MGILVSMTGGGCTPDFIRDRLISAESVAPDRALVTLTLTYLCCHVAAAV